jgi:hypothetical protein
MRIRFASYLCVGIAAAFLVFATVAFSLPTIAALAVGVGVGMLAVSLNIAVPYRKDLASLATGGAIAAVSAWTVLASQVFSQSTVEDLTFASAVAVGVLAMAGLTAEELRTERVVHSLEVRQGGGERERDWRPIATSGEPPSRRPVARPAAGGVGGMLFPMSAAIAALLVLVVLSVLTVAARPPRRPALSRGRFARAGRR